MVVAALQDAHRLPDAEPSPLLEVVSGLGIAESLAERAIVSSFSLEPPVVRLKFISERNRDFLWLILSWDRLLGSRDH